jgi:hypothetical protein
MYPVRVAATVMAMAKTIWIFFADSGVIDLRW